jgi:hypothetical protein
MRSESWARAAAAAAGTLCWLPVTIGCAVSLI